MKLLAAALLASWLTAGCGRLYIRSQATAPPDDRTLSQWLSAGDAALRLQQSTDAETYFRYALALDPTSPAAAAGLAEASWRLDEPARAERLFRIVHRRAPDHDAARIGLAWIYFSAGETNKIPPLLNPNSDRFADLHLLGTWLVFSGDATHGRALLRKARALATGRGSFADPNAVADIDCRLSEHRSTSTCPLGPIRPDE